MEINKRVDWPKYYRFGKDVKLSFIITMSMTAVKKKILRIEMFAQ